MAIFHLNLKAIGLGDERSAVACAAYRAGARLWNQRLDGWSEFAERPDLVHAEVLAPDGAPLWARQREELWNRVEAAEKRKDARLAREVEIALPVELDRPGQLGLARAFAEKLVALGLAVDLAVHDKGDGNPHAHLMFTTRKVGADGLAAKKERQLDSPKFLAWLRRGWGELQNAALAGAGQRVRVDHRSLAAQGIAREPTKHRGVDRAERRRKREEQRERRKAAAARSVPADDARAPKEPDMKTSYDALVEIQRELDANEREARPATVEEVRERSDRDIALRASRDHLLGHVERETLEEGRGLGEADQKELLDGWDERNRPRPEDYPDHPEWREGQAAPERTTDAAAPEGPGRWWEADTRRTGAGVGERVERPERPERSSGPAWWERDLPERPGQERPERKREREGERE